MLTILVSAAFAVFPSLPLHVDGTRLLDSNDQIVHLRGVNVPSLEWDANGDHVLESVHQALDLWHANVIRLPLSQDRWFGKAPDSKDDGTSYRNLVSQIVREVRSRGDHVLLDLHWSDGGVWGQNIGQHTLPDAHSLQFWTSCATQFRRDPSVMFDLYNEPIKAPWSVWKDGGDVTETFQNKTLSYKAVGMQTLLDAIRATGARTLCAAGGLGYASQLDFPESALLKDPSGNGVVYTSHFYPGWEDVPSWQSRIEKASKRLPILIGEFGDDAPTAPMDTPAHRIGQIFAVINKNDFNFIVWCLHPAAHPCLIKDWNYTPTPEFGSLVKLALDGDAVPIPPRRSSAPTFHVYDGKLEDPWQSWGSAKLEMGSSERLHESSASIKVTIGAGQQLQLGTVPFDGLAYKSIHFWIHGESGGQKLLMHANLMDVPERQVSLPTLTSSWTEITVPFTELGIEGRENVKSFVIRSADGQSTAPFYIAAIDVIGK
jgi:endoglucanase